MHLRKIARRSGRIAQEPDLTSFVLVRGLRHAGAPCRRTFELPARAGSPRPYSALLRQLKYLLNATNRYPFMTPCRYWIFIATGSCRVASRAGRSAAPRTCATVGEAGFPKLVVQGWVGLLVKAGTPNETVARLNAAINKVLALPNVREAFAKMAAEPGGGTPAEFGSHVKSQMLYWSKVSKSTGMKMHQ